MAQPTDYLKSIKSESVVQQVINCLTDAMISKRLKPGDQIPTEPELAEALGVARTSVREATKILNYLGVLESKRAEGTFVASGFQESMIDPMVYGVILNQDENFQHLMELREMTEVGMLRLAIQKRDENDLALLKEKLEDMERIAAKEGDILEEFFAADNVFHDAVSALCRNPMADKVNRVVRTLTFAVRHDTVETMIKTGRAQELIDAHWKIFDMLRNRDANAMEENIRNTYFLNVDKG
ncbi:MAG: FCD domain-containing protein [Clostridia bacterium]|nr:FCD domain-containing protein [Clostridia bacterium]